MSDLNLQNLFFSYHNNKVLKNISFKVRSGEFVGIVGPNGSGKTTMLRCITKNLKMDKGSIFLSGKNINKVSYRDIAKEIGVVPQGGTVDFGFSVKDIVLMGRNPHQSKFTFETKEDSKIVESSLKSTGTWEFRDKPVQQLSGGEFQRVLIARALAQRPKILLLDEPTTHLDISHQLEIMDIMANLNKEKKITILGVFHDLNLAARYCKRLLLLNRGNLVADGPIEEVMTAANLRRVFNINSIVRRNPITNNLFIDPIAIVPSSGADKSILEETEESRGIKTSRYDEIYADQFRKKIHVICGAGTGSAIMNRLVEEGYDISTGVLNVLDQDHQTAEELKIPTVREAAFSPISSKTHQMNLEMIRNSDIIILTNVPFGSANKLNMKSVEFAKKNNKFLIFYEPEDSIKFNIRDFTGGEAGKIHKKLISSAKTASSMDEIIEIIHKIEIPENPKSKNV